MYVLGDTYRQQKLVSQAARCLSDRDVSWALVRLVSLEGSKVCTEVNKALYFGTLKAIMQLSFLEWGSCARKQKKNI